MAIRLDNILLYARGYAPGDVVSVENRDGELYVEGLVLESGHSTIRILFEKKEEVEDVRQQLNAMGCESEISNIPILIAVDIPPDKWGYEEACIAHKS